MTRPLSLSVDTVLPTQTTLDGTHVTVMEEANTTATTNMGDFYTNLLKNRQLGSSSQRTPCSLPPPLPVTNPATTKAPEDKKTAILIGCLVTIILLLVIVIFLILWCQYVCKVLEKVRNRSESH